MSESELPARIRALHQWYCETMGTPLPLHPHVEQFWFYWIKAGHNGPQLRKVIVYLRREIRAGKRNMGALLLRNLLDPDTFAENLVLAGHNLSVDNKVPALPNAESGERKPETGPSSVLRPPTSDRPVTADDFANFRKSL